MKHHRQKMTHSGIYSPLMYLGKFYLTTVKIKENSTNYFYGRNKTANKLEIAKHNHIFVYLFNLSDFHNYFTDVAIVTFRYKHTNKFTCWDSFWYSSNLSLNMHQGNKHIHVLRLRKQTSTLIFSEYIGPHTTDH